MEGKAHPVVAIERGLTRPGCLTGIEGILRRFIRFVSARARSFSLHVRNVVYCENQ